jgi:protein-disulfide isomerase
MTKRILTCFMAMALPALFSLAPAAAQSQDLRAEIEALKDGQEVIAKDVAAIKEMLEAMQPQKPKPFEPMDITLSGSPFQGNLDAKVTLVEFTDYQCPFCKRHKTGTMPEILKNYVETGKVKYYLREFPLISIHPRAAKASEAALCGGDQGKYWELHEALFSDQKKMSDADFIAHAASTGLDVEAFKACLSGGKHASKVKADLDEGMKAGVRGTPSFVLGLTDPNNDEKFRATQFIRGAQPYAAFQKAIDELLAGGGDAKAEAKTE